MTYTLNNQTNITYEKSSDPWQQPECYSEPPFIENVYETAASWVCLGKIPQLDRRIADHSTAVAER
jgi:hypothetical protein